MSSFWPVRLSHGPVALRPVRRKDEADWVRIRRQAGDWFRDWDSTRPPGSSEPSRSFAQLVAANRARARLGLALPWAIDYTPTDQRERLVGQVTVSGITRGSACWAQMGYWIDPAWAGRGIVPVAVAMATDYCFEELGLHRIEIAIRPENANSLAVVRKLGFRYEGRRERYMHVAGAWRDHDMFVLTPEEVSGRVLARLESRRPPEDVATGG